MHLDLSMESINTICVDVRARDRKQRYILLLIFFVICYLKLDSIFNTREDDEKLRKPRNNRKKYTCSNEEERSDL